MNGQQLKNLEQALLGAFPNERDLARMVRYGLDENLETITQAPNQQSKIFDLIQWSETNGKLDMLINAAMQANPDNASLQEWVTSYNIGKVSESVKTAWQAYHEALIQYTTHYPYLALEALLPNPHPTLDEIYVPLRARPWKETTRRASRRSSSTNRLNLTISDVLHKMVTTSSPNALVILGPPGAGKSTLLRRLARDAWDAPAKCGLPQPYMPLPIRFSALARSSGATTDAWLLDALHKGGDLLIHGSLPTDFFTAWPKQQHAPWLLLIDALDEVASDQLPALLARLQALLGTILPQSQSNLETNTSASQGLQMGIDIVRSDIQVSLSAENTTLPHMVVMTSRSTLDFSDLLQEPNLAYELRPFTRNQQERLASAWLAEKAQAFQDELDRVQIDELVATPLLLTIAAAVFARDATLPAQRASLYERFVRILLEEAVAQGLRADLPDSLALAVRSLLQHLARAMSERPHNISGPELGLVVATFLIDEWGFPRGRAMALADTVLTTLSRRSGVFVLRGDQGGWVHPTFREYLTAYALVECCAPSDTAIQQVVKRWRDPLWRQTVLFMLSLWALPIGTSKTPQDVTPLLQPIVTKDDDGLLFVGQALAEGAPMAPDLAKQVVSHLVSKPLSSRSSQSSQILAVLARLQGWPEVTLRLELVAADRRVDEDLRIGAARALSALGNRKEANNALRVLAQDLDLQWHTHIEAARLLGKLGYRTEAAELLHRLAENHHLRDDDRMRAARAYEYVADQEDAVALWSQLAKDDRLGAVARIRSASRLAGMERRATAASLLYELVFNFSLGESIRMEAAYAYSEIGLQEEIRTLWEDLAQDPRSKDHNRLRAAQTLADLGWPERAGVLLSQLAKDYSLSPRNRIEAIQLYSKLGSHHDTSALWRALAEDHRLDNDTRIKAAEFLAEEGQRAEAAILLRTLAQDSWLTSWQRLAAIETLEKLGLRDEAIILLSTLARNAQLEADACLSAAHSYAKLTTQEDAAALWREIAKDRQMVGPTRIHAARALGGLGWSEEARSLMYMLAQDQDVSADIRLDAARAYGQAGPKEDIIELWLALAEDSQLKGHARIWAVDMLEKLGYEKERVRLLVRGFAQAPELMADARLNAAHMYSRLATKEEAANLWRVLAVDHSLARDARITALKQLNKSKDKEFIEQALRELDLNPELF